MNNVIQFDDYVFPISRVPPGDRLREYENGPCWVFVGQSLIDDKQRFYHYTCGNGYDRVDIHTSDKTRVKYLGNREFQIV